MCAVSFAAARGTTILRGCVPPRVTGTTQTTETIMWVFVLLDSPVRLKLVRLYRKFLFPPVTTVFVHLLNVHIEYGCHVPKFAYCVVPLFAYCVKFSRNITCQSL